MKYNQSMASILAEMRKNEQEDPVQKAQDKLDKAKKIADLKKQIDTVRQEGKMSQMHMMIKQKKTSEQIAKALKLDLNTVKALMKEAVDPQDTGGAAEVDMIMNQVTQMRHFLDGIEKMVSDDGDVEEWVQGKITKATDYLKTAYSYKTGEKNEALDKEDEPAVKKLVKNLRKGSKTHAKQADELEKDLKDETDLEEFKKMVVTIKDPLKRRKAMDDIKRFGKKTGFRIDKMRDGKSFKIDGKGADLNKFATDMKNFYGAEIKAESYNPLEESPVQDFARKLAGYATKHGGIDKKDFMKIANKMVNAKNDGDIKKIGQQVDDMDTEPRDLIKGAIAIRMGAKTYQKMFGDRLRPSDIQQYKSMTPRYMKEDIDEKDVTNDMLITEFTSAQIKRLKKEYEPLRGVHHTELQPARFTQLSKMMQRMGKSQLQALVKADIPVLSSAAKASLVVNHGMKFSSIKEELIPYLEVFPLDENRKSKFKSVAPEVIDRIEKMMRGSREEKDSIANMLNYMMPPEVVDMVRDKLKITAKRGKIRF